MICSTGKPPSRLLKTFNGSSSEFSTRSTGFNDLSWGDQMREFIKLINKRLRPESYDNIIAGAQDIAKKTQRAIQTEEIIDLTNDELLDEFAMLVDVPLDEDIDKQDAGGNSESGFDNGDDEEVPDDDDDDDEGGVPDNDDESMLKYF